MAHTQLGRFNKKITIQSIDVDRTTGGETTDTPVSLATAWAKILPISGREGWLAGSPLDTTTHAIRIPYQAGITARMQAVYGSRTFQFQSVTNVDEADVELEIMAVEVLP